MFNGARVCGGPGDYDHLAEWLDRPNDSFDAVSAGTNHFNWLLRISDTRSGDDLYPQLRAAAEYRAGPLTRRCLKTYDLLPLSGDSHIAEFLPCDPAVMERGCMAFHGTADERRGRRESLSRMAQGQMPWDSLLENRAWERPADIIEAILRGRERRLVVLNGRNAGVVPELAADVIVETPAVIAASAVHLVPIGPMPDKIFELLQVTAQVNTMAGRAAARRDRRMLH